MLTQCYGKWQDCIAALLFFHLVRTIAKKNVSLHILSFICFQVFGTSDETLALVFDILHLVFISQPLVKIRAILTKEIELAKIFVMVKQLDSLQSVNNPYKIMQSTSLVTVLINLYSLSFNNLDRSGEGYMFKRERRETQACFKRRATAVLSWLDSSSTAAGHELIN